MINNEEGGRDDNEGDDLHSTTRGNRLGRFVDNDEVIISMDIGTTTASRGNRKPAMNDTHLQSSLQDVDVDGVSSVGTMHDEREREVK